MESFAQPMSAKVINLFVYAGETTVPHFEALRRSLNLPLTAVVDDALNFEIGYGMKVTALLSDTGRCLLMVELVDMASLLVEDWQRLAMHLSSHFEDEHMGRLAVLDNQLTMVWSHSAEMRPGLWVQEAKRAMLWCLGARELLGGHGSPVHQ